MKVLKFGGSSISTPDRVLAVLDIVCTSQSGGENIAVVVSAFGGVTDQLIEMSSLASQGDKHYADILSKLKTRHVDCVKALVKPGERKGVVSLVKDLFRKLEDLLLGMSLVKELPYQTRDLILSFGERLSATIISASFKSHGIDAEFMDARKVIKTDRTFGSARVDMKTTLKNIRHYFTEHSSIQIMTGFIGSTKEEKTTTLGRSGSDYSAAILGAALKADVIEIWTDVDGVMTADPRKVPDAFSIKSMTYEEAMEMSHFGAKVIFPPTMQPAMSQNIPIRIRNTFNPKFYGTVIKKQVSDKENMITGISSISEVALIRVQGSGMIGVAGISGRIFKVLSEKNISVILITQASSEHSICFAVNPEIASNVKEAIDHEFYLEIQSQIIDKVKIEYDLSILAIVGEKMRHTPGIAGKVFDALGDYRINVVAIAQGSSERNISVVIDQINEASALRALHGAFFNSHKKTIDLFIVGTGLVGSELLRLINHTKHPETSFHVLGLANSRKMFIDPEGISLDTWKTDLENSDISMDGDRFVKKMVENKSAHTVFVDCTSSTQVVDRYREVLSHDISVVTPNKIANTGSWKDYIELRNTAAYHDVKFLYRTNVGGGLPIIHTIKSLVESGDTIEKIEGIFSGSLSYLFNTFTGEEPFSSIVRQARELGYTEPDPRNDLNGLDAGRKLLILAREIGLQYELKDIQVESLLPEGSETIHQIEDFFVHLQESDDYFESRRFQAAKEGKVLRYVGLLENGQATVGLREVEEDHPFGTLTVCENIFIFVTERYRETPLIIRGTGAGATVTASGVYTDILQTVS